MNRDEAIRRIRAALKQRSRKPWSVTGGRGTSWGWITIQAAPARQDEWGYTSEADGAELAELLGLERIHQQGVNVPASNQYYAEYVDRAEGRTPAVCGSPYWD